ncbi:MAG: hypothetical protein MUC94_13935 [bacterium]|nr:hypothetical protein [bacterium]
MSIKKDRKFWTGIILIILSYVFWGAFFFTIVALKGESKKSLYYGAMLYGLNWGCFGVGILLAGKAGVRYTKKLTKQLNLRSNKIQNVISMLHQTDFQYHRIKSTLIDSRYSPAFIFIK